MRLAQDAAEYQLAVAQLAAAAFYIIAVSAANANCAQDETNNGAGRAVAAIVVVLERSLGARIIVHERVRPTCREER